MKQKIQTASAPKAIGPYSQAIKSKGIVYLAGQIPLDPKTMALISDNVKTQAQQVFKNMQAVCKEAGGDLNLITRLTIYLMDLADFPTVNEVMAEFFQEPYPARTTIQVAGLPKSAKIEIDAMMVID